MENYLEKNLDKNIMAHKYLSNPKIKDFGL